MAVVTQIQVRRGTASQWTSANPTLAAGEWGYETDTGKVKIGNGSTAWTSLSYIGSGTVTSITAGTGLSGGTITSSGTIAIDSTVATLTGSQTLTNKTLTSPVISSISNTGTVTLPTATTRNYIHLCLGRQRQTCHGIKRISADLHDSVKLQRCLCNRGANQHHCYWRRASYDSRRRWSNSCINWCYRNRA